MFGYASRRVGAKVAAVLKENRNSSCRLIEVVTSIPKFTIQRINNKRVSRAHDFLEMIDMQPNFLECMITGDEIWCFGYDPGTK